MAAYLREGAKMRRFVLIDQSITGEGGHYLTYARSVLDGAQEEGFLPVLCVNHRFSSTNEVPYCLYSAFTYTSPESISTFRLRGTAEEGSKRGYLWGGAVKPTIQRMARCVFGAHYKNIRDWILPSDLTPQREVRERHYKSARFAKDLHALLSDLCLNREDIVFFPTLSIVELCGLEQTLRGLDREGLPVFRLLFRWNPFRGRREAYDKELKTLRYAQDSFRRCEDLYEEGVVRFYTDSSRLKEQYELFSQCRFSVLPIPHTDSQMNSTWRERKVRIISYLGDARPEKGFLHLPEVVATLSNEEVQFQIQANFNIPGGEGGIAACRRRLRKRRNVALYETALCAEEYAAALARTDIMLILYNPEQYYARSSGIFAEAMAAGVPALVPADTWMSAQVCRGRYVQLRRIVEWFDGCQTGIEVIDGELFWKREKSCVKQIILRFAIDWNSGGDSIHVETIMESKDKAEIARMVDFIERAGDRDCFLYFEVPEECDKIRCCLRGTYGQRLPQIREVNITELCGDTPVSGGICRIFDSYDQCGAILQSMIKNYANIRKSTERYAEDWSRYHNPKAFIRQLILL